MKKLILKALIKEEIRNVLKEQQSNIELIGTDKDELLNAITFINTGLTKTSKPRPHSFGKNTLKALDSDGHSIDSGKFSGKFSISVEVETKVPNKNLYIKQVNDLLDDHGFECKLYMTK